MLPCINWIFTRLIKVFFAGILFTFCLYVSIKVAVAINIQDYLDDDNIVFAIIVMCIILTHISIAACKLFFKKLQEDDSGY